MEPEEKDDVIRSGSKIKYKHGRGFALGDVDFVKDGIVGIFTKNGGYTSRPLESVTKADPDFVSAKSQLTGHGCGPNHQLE